MEQLLSDIDNEKVNRFMKPWAKLDKGSKLNRIVHFVGDETQGKELNEKEEENLKKILIIHNQSGLLNKVGEVEYCDKEYKILSIKNLNYDEEGKTYTFNISKKQIKPASKSKSNVDRHFSRSKENKR